MLLLSHMQQSIPWEKIHSLEEEIKALKSLGKKPVAKKKLATPFNNLYGILKGVKVTEKDFKEAEKSLFPYGTK